MPTGMNPGSRWALLCAMSEGDAFVIDRYVEHTIDWSRTPDGHYYSNKAPGPALIAFPIFKALDLWQTRGISDRAERDRRRFFMRGANMRLLSFLFQVIPFLLLAFWWVRRLEKNGVSAQGVSAAAMALLLGNTACIFLNSFFGHGFTAVCALGLLAAGVVGSVGLSAFFFGWAVLSDYSAAVFFVPLLFYWVPAFLKSRARARWVLHLCLGASLPGVLWVVYHTLCFGGAFAIANSFQNPIFVDHDVARLWGILSLPDPLVAWQLLFGSARGLLWTQPWVLILLLGPLLVRLPRPAAFSFVAFGLLFLVNVGFNGWHGGNSAGPRYLSAGLVLMGVTLGLLWDRFRPSWQTGLKLAVSLSVLFQLVLLSVYRMPLLEPLWRFYFGELTGEKWTTPAARLAITLPIALVLIQRTWRHTRKERASRDSFSPAEVN